MGSEESGYLFAAPEAWDRSHPAGARMTPVWTGKGKRGWGGGDKRGDLGGAAVDKTGSRQCRFRISGVIF